jgi:hypothetical protein
MVPDLVDLEAFMPLFLSSPLIELESSRCIRYTNREGDEEHEE